MPTAAAPSDTASSAAASSDDPTADPSDGPPTEHELRLRKRLAELEARLSKSEADARAGRDHAFVKGWLAGVGDVDFIPEKHRFVVGLQMFPIEESAGGTLTRKTYYLGAVPRISLHFGKLYMGFELPLAFQVYDEQVDSADPTWTGGTGFGGAGTFAGLQWDEPADYSQIVNYLRYGTKEDKTYLNVSKHSAATVGHGTTLRRYNPNIDQSHLHVSAQLDRGFEYGGAEFYTNDIVRYGVNSVLAYTKPGGLILPQNRYVRSASIGLSFSFDRSAPYALARSTVDPRFLVADAHQSPAVEEVRVASVLELDGELKVYKKNGIDVKTYVDYSRLLNTGGDGVSVGALARINLGGDRADSALQAFRLRAEVGAYHTRFAPGYFDMFYEIQKYQAMFDPETGQAMTKLQYLETRTGGYRPGMRLEATWSLVNSLALSAAYQTSSEGRDSQMLVHAELPTGDHLRFLLTYARLNPGRTPGMFTLNDPDALLIAKARMKVLPFLFLNGEVSQMYHLKGVSSDGATLSETVAGQPAQFRNVLRWILEAEVGFEF